MPSIAALAKALDSFQTLISSIYDALKNGPKQRRRLSKEIIKETSLSFGYAFSGSVGMVLTLPTPEPSHRESKRLLDKSIDVFFRLAKATTASEIAKFVDQIGLPPIRALSKWATTLTAHGLGADIEWEGQHTKENRLFIQTPELDHLSRISAEMSAPTAINPFPTQIHQGGFRLPLAARENLSKMESMVGAESASPTEEDIEVEGFLVGVDIQQQTFHIRLPAGDDITGTLMGPIDSEFPIELSKRYRARLRKTTEDGYPTDEYHLLALEPSSPK